ncbi:MAG: PspC domain-containing protein, partial [Gordonia sp. (in: high G+C Gram-positive bacteria)]
MNSNAVHDLWNTRPVRLPADGMATGVCAGIAARYRVDPTLVRVAFVVATVFGGSGVLVYIAALLCFPSVNHLPHQVREERRRRRFPAVPRFVWMIVATVVVVSMLGSDSTWTSSGVVSAGALLLGWWLLYQRTPVAPAGTSVDTMTPDPAAAGAYGPMATAAAGAP